jgi:diguanylate cyclase (GGDEF)-like protein
MSPAEPPTLSNILDAHIAWFAAWHRLAFLDPAPRAKQADRLEIPAAFDHWLHEAMQTLPHDQPALDNVRLLHEQLHTLARLVLMKTPDGAPLAAKDYDNVSAKYQEFMLGLRRLERAFAAAESRLDALTGLRTRLGLREDLQRELSRGLRNNKTFCVAVMDIDHFKKINDTHGHDAGDRVLAAVADHVSRSVRPFDDAYRMGGEEFLLCLKESDLAIGLAVLERLRAGLEKTPVTLANGTRVPVTASFGVSVSGRDAAVDDMIRKADSALYRAKNTGRNRIIAAETGKI